jgi:hypothetical protein
VVTDPNIDFGFHRLNVSDENEFGGKIGIHISTILCASDYCKKITLKMALFNSEYVSGRGWGRAENQPALAIFPLLPESAAKSQPAFIPAPLREDYREACRVRDLSPKAAATLARRCLQGMIRDFCDISKSTLHAEILELRRLIDAGDQPRGVTHESMDAIDAVRSVGNIGAHMERDIDVIVPVDADEAQLLIELIELLFEEWYVARNKREQRLSAVRTLADSKRAHREAEEARLAQEASAPGE